MKKDFHPLFDQLIVAVDFDGTITTGEKELKLRPHCKEVLLRLKEKGIKFILWTCRSGDPLQEAINFLQKEGFLDVFSTVNRQLPEVEKYYEPYASPKVGATYYLDNQNMFQKTIDWLEVETFLISELIKRDMGK